MIKYHVTKVDSQVTLVVSSPDDVYDPVKRISGDDLMAIAASGWADIACVGDTFETDDFSVEVVDE